LHYQEKVDLQKNYKYLLYFAIAGKTQDVNIKLYNLDVIISVGYRVKSPQGTQFRI